MRLALIAATFALISPLALCAEPVMTPQQVKACIMDDAAHDGNVNEVLMDMGALKTRTEPKTIKLLHARKADTVYEFLAYVDFGKVKADVMVSCIADQKSPSGSGLGMLMIEPTMLAYRMPTNGMPPSADGNRGKLWRQYEIGTMSKFFIDHQM
jgi:hypothetical protein